MTEFTGLDANVAVVRYLARKGASLPERAFNELTQAIAEPDGLRAITTALEALYASREAIDDEGRELGADVARFVSSHNLAGYGASGRGLEIAAAMQRAAEGGDPVHEDDPEPEPRFVEPPSLEAFPEGGFPPAPPEA